MDMIEIFSQPTSHKNLVILAFIELSWQGGGGADSAPPLSRAHNVGPIPGRGLKPINPYNFGSMRLTAGGSSGEGGRTTPPPGPDRGGNTN